MIARRMCSIRCLALVLSAVAVAFLIAAMWLGGKLTYIHGMPFTRGPVTRRGPPGAGDSPGPPQAPSGSLELWWGSGIRRPYSWTGAVWRIRLEGSPCRLSSSTQTRATPRFT